MHAPNRPEPGLMRLLFGLTVVSGVVDAVCYLALGRVFVANMTGNVVFLGFALAGAGGLSVPASLTALAAFLGAGFFAGRILAPRRAAPFRLLRDFTTAQLALLGVAFVLALAAPAPVLPFVQYSLIVVLGVAMGIQNTGARLLAIPDVTTTVLTMTLTGLASEAGAGVESRSRTLLRIGSVAAMLGGAAVGAVLVLRLGLAPPLFVATVLVAAVTLLARRHVSQPSGPPAPTPSS